MLDQRISNRAAGFVQTSIGRWTALAIAHSGDSQWWFAAGILLWWLGSGLWRTAGVRVVWMTIMGALVCGVLKRLIGRERPQESTGWLYLPFDRHGFPSGHATRVGGLIVVLGSMEPAKYLPVLVLWGLAVGGSRVALGVHFVSDIVAGMALGALIGVVLCLIVT